jgi:hypothetical protein
VCVQNVANEWKTEERSYVCVFGIEWNVRFRLKFDPMTTHNLRYGHWCDVENPDSEKAMRRRVQAPAFVWIDATPVSFSNFGGLNLVFTISTFDTKRIHCSTRTAVRAAVPDQHQ